MSDTPMPERGEERLLFTLKTRGAMTAHHLARRLDISVVAVRKQLARLAEAGFVTHRELAEGRGRPERLWRLTAEGHQRFPDSHSDLTLELIASVRAVFGEDGLNRLIKERERVAEAAYDAELRGRADLEDRVAALARMRRREGYMAEVERLGGEAFLLVENHCPICAAAEACQGFCRSELAVFRSVLGSDVSVVRTDHILAGARRCAYRIEPRNRQTHP